MNKIFADKSEHIYCSNCLGRIATIENAAAAYRISYICKCGNFDNADRNAEEIEKETGAPLYNRDGNLVCPKCRSVLLVVEENSMRSFAFKIRCSCGAVYSERRDAPKSRRNLGVYAINDK